MSKTAPKFWTDPSDRKALALDLRKQIDAYKASMSSRFDSWNHAQDVYDEVEVLSSLSFLDGAEPYNASLARERVDGVVQDVVGPICSASPYFVFKGMGASNDRMEDAEKTVHYALDLAHFDRKVRDAGQMAGLRGRGMIRCRYQTITDNLLADELEVDTMDAESGDMQTSNEEGEVQTPTGGNVRYTGLILESFKPEDCIIYPSYVDSIVEATIAGHAFFQRFKNIELKQQMGRYFDDVAPQMSNDAINGSETPVVSEVDNYGVLCYDLVIKAIPPKNQVSGKARDERRYRVTLQYNNAEILDMEPYELPTLWYFAPGLKYDIGTFYPRRSIMEKLMEFQTIYNDAWSLLIFGSAASAFTNVAVSGFVGQQQSSKTGIGLFTYFRGSPSFTPIPTRFDPNGCIFIIENGERIADGIAGFSRNAQGQQLSGDGTATEAELLNQGQNASLQEKTANMGIELERLADLARFMIAENFEEFKVFHGDAIPVNDPADLRTRISIEINGKTPGKSPQATLQKINTLVSTARSLGVQPIPATKVLSIDGVMEVILNELELSCSTSKVYTDPPPPPQVIGPDGQPIPPEIVQQLLAQQGGVPPQAMGRGPSGAQGPANNPQPPNTMGGSMPGPGPM